MTYRQELALRLSNEEDFRRALVAVENARRIVALLDEYEQRRDELADELETLRELLPVTVVARILGMGRTTIYRLIGGSR